MKELARQRLGLRDDRRHAPSPSPRPTTATAFATATTSGSEALMLRGDISAKPSGEVGGSMMLHASNGVPLREPRPSFMTSSLGSRAPDRKHELTVNLSGEPVNAELKLAGAFDTKSSSGRARLKRHRLDADRQLASGQGRGPRLQGLKLRGGARTSLLGRQAGRRPHRRQAARRRKGLGHPQTAQVGT